MSQFLKVFFFSTATISLLSCYNSPDSDVQYADLDMVITNYDKSVSYPLDFQTFSISDSFALASNTEEVDIDKANEPKFRNNIKTAISKNMISLGYTPWDGTAGTNPDIYIPVTISYINTQGINYYPIYWGGAGYGWGYPSYGYGGSYYYYYPTYVPSYYSYDEGSVLIDWIDLKNRYKIPPDTTNWYADNIWNMGISGVIRNATDADRDSRITSGINQGFDQSSSYLKK